MKLLISSAALLLAAITKVTLAQNSTLVDIVAERGYTTLAAAVTAANLLDPLLDPNGTLTLFAPTDAAFAALPGDIFNWLLTDEGLPTLTDILLYHVVAGEVLSFNLTDGSSGATLEGNDITFGVNETEITVNTATITDADIEASNGVIHEIDEVLLPPDIMFPADIVNTAVQAGSFPTLVAALGATDLVEAFSFPAGPFTVFAPSEEAFARLSVGVLDKLLENPSILKQILLHHVVDGEVSSSDLTDGMTVTTLQGATFNVQVGGDGVTLVDGSVSVETTDILATNGVIHVIDRVLIPDNLPPFIPDGLFDTDASVCALEENSCGGDNYLFCVYDDRRDEFTTVCQSEERVVERLDDDDYVSSCGCCESEEDPIDACPSPAPESGSESAPAVATGFVPAPTEAPAPTDAPGPQPTEAPEPTPIPVVENAFNRHLRGQE